MNQRLFRFKQFSMCDEHCGMRIGTDAVLLGAWTEVAQETRRIADVGCGCGIIALMLAQRAQDAVIDAIEIDNGACDDAMANFEASPWSARLHLHKCSFDSFTANEPFDLVVSNPPYFTETLQSPHHARATARHAGLLSFISLAESCRMLLTPTGRLSVVLPSAQDDATLCTASAHGLSPLRHCLVRNSPSSPPVRSLWEFSASPVRGCVEDTLSIRDSSGKFSHDYLELTSEFHIQTVIEKNK